MYFALVIALIFALLLVLNVAASISATVLWRAVSARAAANWTARARAQFIFSLRALPFAAALVFVSAFLLPSYFLFEPLSSDETVSLKLAVVSFISAVGVLSAFYRVFKSWSATRKLLKDWMRYAEPIKVAGVSVPVYRICHPFPVIAVIGTFRPRMFVAAQIFASLTEEEFQAAICHETGHLAARDNFKRMLMRVCRDLLIFPVGRSLDRAWAENAEAGADEFAAQSGGNRTAINLAAALIKIARIVPEGAKPSMPSGAFLIGQQTAEIAFRVQKLLRMTDGENIFNLRNGIKISFWIYSAVFTALVLLLATNETFLFKIHTALETIVTALQ
jgi:Zn-dependent protease with chaperone function